MSAKRTRPDSSPTIREPGENTRFVAHSLSIAQLPPVDCYDPEQITRRLDEYFTLCAQHDMKPNVPGLALAFGVDRTTLWRYANGELKTMSLECVRLYKKAYAFLNAYLEDAGISGKINPAAFIFTAKNHFGYRDQTDVVVAPERKEAPPEEVLIAEAELLDD